MVVIASKNKAELTPYDQELVEVANKVNLYKNDIEGNIIFCIYKKPDLIYDCNLKLSDFSNNIWRVYWAIAYQLLIVQKMQDLDEMTIGFFLEQHEKLKAKYYEYGGFDVIVKSFEYINTKNFDGYVDELVKWNGVLELSKRGFNVKDRIKDYCDMTSEQIYSEWEAFINSIYVNIDRGMTVYDISDGLLDLIDELDVESALGLPYAEMPMLNNETGGQCLGSITLVGGLSNVGKSTFARNACIPSCIQYGTPVVCMINEDGIKKWQRELLIYVSNNILKNDIQKYELRNGNYTPELKQKLIDAAHWIQEQTQNHIITVIPFTQYKTSNVLKVIKKYSALGVKHFVLDTFKLDSGKVSEHSWLEMQQHMVEINDLVKPEVKNVHILITFQLSKGSVHQRYYTQDSIGMAKNIIDVASTCIMIRDVYDDEYPGEKRQLHVFRREGKNGNTKIPVKLDTKKHYQILFIIKNREGSANQYQIVVEHDLSRNMMREVGICNVMPDF